MWWNFKFLLACVILFHGLGASAFAQDARLVEAAKKEGGKVVVYGSLENDTIDAIGKAFADKMREYQKIFLQ